MTELDTTTDETPDEEPTGLTYLVVDGENIDATLGTAVLNRRPNPDERPRWDRVLDFVEDRWKQPAKGLFFLNGSSGNIPTSFVQALLAMGYRPIPLSGPPGVKVVDKGIERMLEAIVERDGDVVLASHDGDFLPSVQTLRDNDRKVGVVAFREFLNAGFLNIPGVEVYDLEYEVDAFTYALPRVKIIPIEDFNPWDFL